MGSRTHIEIVVPRPWVPGTAFHLLGGVLGSIVAKHNQVKETVHYTIRLGFIGNLSLLMHNPVKLSYWIINSPHCDLNGMRLK